MFELLDLLLSLRRLKFRFGSPGTGPYIGSWTIWILDRRTGQYLVSLCHTKDGWCGRLGCFGAGLYQKGSEISNRYDRWL